MNFKWKILMAIIPGLLLLSACTSPSTLEPSSTTPDNQEATTDNNAGGVPIVLPTFTIPEPANVNPGKIIGTVYISDRDRDFHRSDCPRLAIVNTPINRQSAIIQGYSACSVCNP